MPKAEHMAFDRKRVFHLGKRLKDEVSEDDISGAAAELAYRFFLALFPFLIFIAALGGFIASNIGVQDPTGEIMEMIGDSLPEDSAGVLETQLRSVLEQRNGGLLSVGILGAIWAAASGVGSLMKTMNRIYGVGETRGMVGRTAIALGLTIAGAGFMVLAFVILLVGQLYGPQLAGEIGLENTAADVLGLVRWPAAVVLVMVAVAFMYWLAPNAEVPLKWISPGAVFFTLGWIIASIGFAFYVANFGSYNQTYGALGAVVVLLIWFYLTGFLLLLGVEINSVLTEEVAEEDVKPKETAALEGKAGANSDGTYRGPAPEPNRGPMPRPVGLAIAGLVWVAALAGVMRRRAV